MPSQYCQLLTLKHLFVSYCSDLCAFPHNQNENVKFARHRKVLFGKLKTDLDKRFLTTIFAICSHDSQVVKGAKESFQNACLNQA